MTVTRSYLTREYLRYQVTAKVLGRPVDPTSDLLQFAFTARGGTPVNWVLGAWETDTAGKHWATCLVGPGGAFTPADDTMYDVWIKITDSPEIPVRRIDLLVIED